jgi:RHS repeat-associated protein
MSILKVRLFLSGFAIVALLPNSLLGQVGNDNPTGPSGEFNGNITTGCSYDPLTGNSRRYLVDLAIASGVSSYPLAFARTSNSRGYETAFRYQFGEAGSWRHSYSWSMEDSPFGETQPSQYFVYLPDGRLEIFSSSPSDNYFRAAPGTRERFQPLDLGTMLAYLVLPDGGKVQFTATPLYSPYTGQWYSYRYKATAIIDPYGQITTLTYNVDGSLSRIQEPAGRWIQISYVTEPWWTWIYPNVVIDHVQASDGRVVQYNYSWVAHSPGTIQYTQLDSVVYPADPGSPSPVAYYTYQAPNIPDYQGYYNAYPLLSTCDDPMYDGPMKRIAYVYATANDDGSSVVAGQIRSENYFDGVNVGEAVSTLTINSSTSRTETRGDGPSRTFNYSEGKLADYTDFKGHSSSISYDDNGYVWSFTDARIHTTTTLREGTIGAISVLTHPDPEQSTQRFDYKYVDGAPYFMQIRGDERNLGSNTYFTRDPVTNRITKIWYPDYPNGPTEEFTYNGFGQMETHTMTSGGVENFRYDGRGLKYLSWPPPTPSDPNPDQHPTQYFYYTSGPQMDRLWYVVDPRGYSTRFEYNVRGQVTKVTHDQDHTYAQYGYNLDGTLAWTADENHPNASWNVNERTRYTYDDYKRVLSVTNSLNKTTTFSYALDWAHPLRHTTASIKHVLSPLNKNVVFDYDENFRKLDQAVALGTPDEAWTLFRYDEVGNLINLISVQGPRWDVTTFGYDERNRRTSATDPYPFDNQITRWEYDTRSNLTKETRPDLSYRRIEYDPQSRVIDTYGFANEHTHYERDLAGNVRAMTDPKPAASGTYFFGYDKMNRKTSATYPMDATQTVRSEGWNYDIAGNMDQYTNPAGQIKTLGYDTRNRLINSSWNSGGGPIVGLGYDDASRLTIVVTNNAVTNNEETRVVFGYDDANRQTWEEQTVAGFPTRRVETPRDNDGNRTGLAVPGWYSLHYDYTQRNQLRTIYDGNWTPWFNYSYDPAGNMTRRQAVYGGINDSTNIVDSGGVSQYDQLNRPMLWEQTGTVNGVSNTAFARSHFKYDNLGRLAASWRDEQSNKGEWFGYDATGQLTGVSYNADQVWTGSPQNANRIVSYTITPDTLNRASMNDTGDVSDYSPNALNQYQNVAGGDIYYDGNFNLLWTGGLNLWHDSANRLTWAQSGEDYGQFVYDGLGRCLKRTIDWETTLIAYDGWQPVVEWDEFGYFKAWNIYGAGADEILWRYSDRSGHLRYHSDRQGNVVALLDYNGNGIESYTYDAFGKPTVTDWSGQNPRPYSWYWNRFMFTGREWLPELGLYDFRNRFYYPAIGRFLQSDPTGFDGGDMNLFRYCGGDPVNGSDPFGLDGAGGNDHAHDRDWNDREVWGYTEPVNVNGYDLALADALRERWSTFTPLNDYFNSLFGDDKSRVDNLRDAGRGPTFSDSDSSIGWGFSLGGHVVLARPFFNPGKTLSGDVGLGLFMGPNPNRSLASFGVYKSTGGQWGGSYGLFGSAGGGPAFWVTNAPNAETFATMTDTYILNVGVGSLNLNTGGGYWQFSISSGRVGFTYSHYTTDTTGYTLRTVDPGGG